MTGRVLIIGNKDRDSRLIQEVLKAKTHFISRLIGQKEFSADVILKFKADIVLLNANGALDAMLKVYDQLKKDKITSELPIILLLDEALLSRPDINLPIGIHDIFSKPVRADECVARLLLTFKKFHRISDKSIIRAGDLEIDVSRYEVRVNGGKVDLTYTEYELLKFLASHPGQVFNRDVLLNKVWGYDYFGGARTVDVHVRRLRAKIEIKSRRYIETMRHIGYKFVASEED